MKNEYDGVVEDSRNGQHRESSQDENKIKEANGESGISPNDRNIVDECTDGQEEPEKIAAALQKVGITTSWSGLLPHPNQFNSYEPRVQNKMLDWNDAMIISESKRQDRMVDAEIKQAYLSSVFSFVFNLSLVLAIFIAFVITENPNVFWAFTLPGASVVANVVIRIKKENKEEDN